MAARPQKLVLIGLDAPIVEAVERYMAEGELPNIKRLVDSGVFCENALAPYPTITPPNWTTIVTGAWAGTHRITCFHVHKIGRPLDEPIQAFDTGDCRAEYLWNAAERDGKKSIIINYPSSWPCTMKHGWQIAGHGLGPNEWRARIMHHRTENSLALDSLISTEELPGETLVVDLRKLDAWPSLPAHKKAVGAEVVMKDFHAPKVALEPVKWRLAALDTAGNGFDAVALSRPNRPEEVLCILRAGEWSPIAREKFKTAEGEKEAVFRVRLVELSSDARKLRLYITPLCDTQFYTYPGELWQELQDLDEIPVPQGSFRAYNLGWIDEETFGDTLDMQHRWLAAAATRLMTTRDWHLYFMHAHAPDHMYHALSTKADRATNPDAAQRAVCESIFRRMYIGLDRMIGDIVKAAGDGALVVVVSDHGAKATGYHFSAGTVLAEAGLMETEKDESGHDRIAWQRTKAVPQRAAYIYVNLKGRDPDGIVEPGEYEKVREQIIDALLTYRDPKTGIRPVALALTREDARSIGLYGEDVGDVVYVIDGRFGGQHGQQFTTARFSQGSVRPLLILCGPGVKKGFRLERNAWLTDIVPTVCYLMSLPIPAQAEGAVLYQALEDPDEPWHEAGRARRNYELLKQQEQKDRALSHDYEL
jgi:predicted AlkP superfamily phosphohydrolase/phosphomutase